MNMGWVVRGIPDTRTDMSVLSDRVIGGSSSKVVVVHIYIFEHLPTARKPQL